MASVNIALGAYAETDVASAGTCDIGAAAALRVRITGTTTITSFGTSANRIRFLRFAGALTLTHNGTSLILPGSANITTVAGDTATAMSDGSGNWRVTNYQRGDGTPLVTPIPSTLGFVASSVWASRPAAASNTNKVIFITDVGVGGGSLFVSDGTDWVPISPVTLARSGAAITIPNNAITTEQQYVSVSVPAGLMGHNGALFVEMLWTYTASANTKTMRARFSGSSGTSVISNAASTGTFITSKQQGLIRNRNSTGSQISLPTSFTGSNSAGSASAVVTASVDTTNATTLYISGQDSATSEVLTLESYEVRLLP